MTFLTNPYRFGPRTWEYTTLAAAESSGDPWVEGDYIKLTDPDPDMEYKYFSALTVVGHSGLFPRYPLDNGVEVASVTVHLDEIAQDPDSYTGFTVDADGTKGVDWDLDTNSGRARLRDISAAGGVRMDSNQSVALGDEKTFMIVNDALAVTPTDGNVGFHVRQYHATAPRIALLRAAAGTSDYWQFLEASSGNANTTLRYDTVQRITLALSDSRAAVWGPNGTGLVSTDVPSFAATALCRLRTDSAGSAGRDLELGYFIVGKFTLTS